MSQAPVDADQMTEPLSRTGRPAHLAEDLIPLTALHDVLREVGLLRPRHGVLH